MQRLVTDLGLGACRSDVLLTMCWRAEHSVLLRERSSTSTEATSKWASRNMVRMLVHAVVTTADLSNSTCQRVARVTVSRVDRREDTTVVRCVPTSAR